MQSNLSTNLLQETSSVEGRMYSTLPCQLGFWCRQRDNVLHAPCQPCPDCPSGVLSLTLTMQNMGWRESYKPLRTKQRVKFESLTEYDASLSFISIEGPPRFSLFLSYCNRASCNPGWPWPEAPASTFQIQVLKQFYNKPPFKKVITKRSP